MNSGTRSKFRNSQAVARTRASALRCAMWAIAALLSCSVVRGQNATPDNSAKSSAAAAAPNLTGFWSLRFDSRNIPKATLLPTVTQKMIDAREAADLHAIRWCQYEGMPYMMQSTAPLDILQGDTQIVIASETPAAVRHIYTDRTTRPDPATFDATRNGFSLGHWEGDKLIVETSGFSGIGYTSIPGGGFRTQTSHLSERYQLVDGGKELEVTFTWTDPKVYAKPHTYAYRYYRVPRGFNAGEDFCDSNDQERAAFLTNPPAPVK